jgi:hypothetical protein
LCVVSALAAVVSPLTVVVEVDVIVVSVPVVVVLVAVVSIVGVEAGASVAVVVSMSVAGVSSLLPPHAVRERLIAKSDAIRNAFAFID